MSFWCLHFLPKTNENKSTSSKVEFVRWFFGINVGLKKSFRISLTFKNRAVRPNDIVARTSDYLPTYLLNYLNIFRLHKIVITYSVSLWIEEAQLEMFSKASKVFFKVLKRQTVNIPSSRDAVVWPNGTGIRCKIAKHYKAFGRNKQKIVDVEDINMTEH